MGENLDLRLVKASRLCEELLDAVEALPGAAYDFAASARTRLNQVYAELRQAEVVTDRQISTLREIAAGVEGRKVGAGGSDSPRRERLALPTVQSSLSDT